MCVIRNNNCYQLGPFSEVYDKLPKGVYMLDFDKDTDQYFLSRQEDFKLPNKIYGDVGDTYRWLTFFNSEEGKKNGNMGILLTGERGTGKSLDAKKFCVESGLPVILINQSFSGPKFVNFLSHPSIGEAIILIDEFEKVYKEKHLSEWNTVNVQENLLSLMDGTQSTRLIFLFTVNEVGLVDRHLNNRPGRIRYRKHYYQVSNQVIQEVAEELLDDQGDILSIFEFADKAGFITFDILIELIKEMNLFGEDALDAAKHMNIVKEESYYEVFEEYKGKTYPLNGFKTTLSPNLSFYVAREGGYFRDELEQGEIDGGRQYVQLVLPECKITRVDRITTKIETRKGLVFIFIKQDENNLIF